MQSRTDSIIRTSAIVLLAIGCFYVLRPFVTAAMLAAVFALATWPAFLRLRAVLRGNHTAAAAAITVLVLALFVVPFALLGVSLGEHFPEIAAKVQEWLAQGAPQPPAWLKDLPLVGQWLDQYWHRVAESREELRAFLTRLVEPGRALLVGAGKAIGQGVLQMTLAVFIGFFFFRDGEALLAAIRGGLGRVAGQMSGEMLHIVEGTVRGVIYGIVGTGLAQGLVAVIGFWIAGVPGALALGAAVAVLSIVPAGPPLVWIGASLWLLSEDRVAWAAFMALYGFFVISSIDNVVKPLLISRGAAMPLVLVLLGVFGGLLAFGFIGLFLGPVLLALGFSLAREWTAGGMRAPKPADAPVEPKRH
jgi:predicted PurR-regulated permease PerM